MKQKLYIFSAVAMLTLPLISFAQSQQHSKSTFADHLKELTTTPDINNPNLSSTDFERRNMKPKKIPKRGYRKNWDNNTDTWTYAHTFTKQYDSSARETMKEEIDTASKTFKNKTLTTYNILGNLISSRYFSSTHADSAYILTSVDSMEYHSTFPSLVTFNGSYSWNNIMQQLDLNWGYRSTYGVDSGRIISQTNENYINPNWSITELKTFIYLNGLLSQLIIYSIANNTDTIDGRKEYYEYDANNVPMRSTISVWDLMTKTWQNSERFDNFVFNNFHGSLVDILILNTLTMDDVQLTNLVKAIWNGSTWENSIKEEHSYSGNTKISTIYNWDNLNNDWIPSTRSKYTANDTLNSHESEIYDGSKFKKDFRYTTRYDKNGLTLDFVSESWTDSVNNYTTQFRNKYELNYNSEGDLLDATMQSWSIWNPVFTNVYQEIYDSWQTFEDNQNNNNSVLIFDNSSNIIVYPNPASNFVNIKFDNSATGNKVIVIKDLSGRTIESFNTDENNLNISLSSYQSGIYIVNIASEKANTVIKLVKE
ncbi:MAG: T9SS type A sorting domain-containing protein [Bacteroidetes bacterium]|nr:T9SS type A sorting domain-containing protein [Bacteroidota bacterium]